MRPQHPEAIIENGKIVNAESLRIFWKDQHHKDGLMRKAVFQSIKEMNIPLTEIKNNDMTLFNPPLPQSQELDRLKAQINYIQRKLEKHLTKPSRPKRDNL